MNSTYLCGICRKPLLLGDKATSTDERGNSVHADCCVKALSIKRIEERVRKPERENNLAGPYGQQKLASQ